MRIQKKFLKRLLLPLAIVMAMAGTVYAIIQAFNENLTFFYSPSQLLSGEVPANKTYRLGGMVEKGSLHKQEGTLNYQFRVTDTKQSIEVRYTGILPDLFKEGKGVVAEGRLEQSRFVASEVLAKHDENYMPPKLKQ